MLSIGLNHYLTLSAVLFAVGLYGALSKRNAVAILMCIEIMFNAVNIAFVAFSLYVSAAFLTGQIFTIFVITVAAAEVAVALAIIIALYRSRVTIDTNEITLMKW